MTKQFESADLIVGENVSALLIEEFELQSLGEAKIAGHAKTLEVFAVLGEIEVPAEVGMSVARGLRSDHGRG